MRIANSAAVIANGLAEPALRRLNVAEHLKSSVAIGTNIHAASPLRQVEIKCWFLSLGL